MTSDIETKHQVFLERGILPPLELRFADAQGEITGYAATFGGEPDAYGDVIAAGAFKASLARHKADKTSPVMLWSHNPDEVVGRWAELREDAKGLLVRGVLNLATQRGQEAHALLKAGDMSGLSIGYRARDYSLGRAGEPPRTLKAVDLVEISLVALPANRAARVSGVKSLLESKADFEDFLHDAGLSRGIAKKLAAGGWSALGSIDETDAGELMRKITAATGDLKALKG